MTTSPNWPPDPCDAVALVRAYTRILDWQFAAGGVPLTGEEAVLAAGRCPDAELLTSCAAFDAVTVACDLGVRAGYFLARCGVEIPSFHTGRQSSTFLVRPGAGAMLSGVPAVEVASGEGGWLALPPAAGRRWSAPPWSTAGPAPAALLDAAPLRGALATAARVLGHGA
ncbi:hypothetical protein [Streptomyces jumonjinensis]|uniref:hypothetical protein n=1 Tax=Streptomyces jumonjinensis TaxID=1945 RepID=UPI00379DC26C